MKKNRVVRVVMLAAAALWAAHLAGCRWPWEPEVEPECSVSPTSVDFGEVPIANFVDRQVTLKNVGEGALRGTVGLSEASGRGCFEILDGAGTYHLDGGESRSVTVRFTPDTTAAMAGTIHAGAGCADVGLTGTGVALPQFCMVVPDSLDFGGVDVGEVRTQTFAIYNVGATALAGTLRVRGGQDADYSIAGDTTYSLPPEASAAFEVRFEPVLAGTRVSAVETGLAACVDVACTGEGRSTEPPITTITRGPCPSGSCGLTGTSVRFAWTHYSPHGAPVDSVFYKLDVGTVESEVDPSWTRVPAECTYVSFTDVERLYPISGAYNSFAVVAQDVYGLREQTLEAGRNWCCFDPVPGLSAEVEIDGGILGTRNNKVTGGPTHPDAVSEVFRGVEIAFSWTADASAYGATIVAYRYALEDTTHWSPWYVGGTRYPDDGSSFVPTAGNHAIYVQALDDAGTVSLCYLKYYVEPGPTTGLTMPVLVVDDSQFSGLAAAAGGWIPGEADAVESEFFEGILEGYDYLEWDCLSRQAAPPVSLVGRCRTVIWYVDDCDGSGENALSEVFRGTRYLDSYVQVGGNLILFGTIPAVYLDPDCRSVSHYPFRYDSPCVPGQPVPISYTAFGLSELTFVPEHVFGGARSQFPAQYPNLPLGETWPFFGYPAPDDSSYLWEVEAFDPGDVNTAVHAIPTYDFRYLVAAGQDSQAVMQGQHCALIVDNAADPATGSTAYFGWALVWCEWDSVAAFMREFLTTACGESPGLP